MLKGIMSSAGRWDELGRTLATALEPWFFAAKRDLSWRRTRDPYAIWVSEVMLQQTRVETVERYYERFLERFPNLGRLAAADEDDVLHEWSGLGYYRRARLLHRGARFVVSEFSGRLPDDVERLRKIPGIGPYTAGALATIAFDKPEPLVDGNVARVLTRFRAVMELERQGAGAKEHWELAAAVMRHGTPRVLAQALMELGATVCTPRSPRCSECPVQTTCAAALAGLADSIPSPRVKPAPTVQHWGALAVVSRGRVLLSRRPPDGLLAGMWSLPLVPLGDERQLDLAVVAELFDPIPRFGDALASVRHVFTHRVWELFPYQAMAPRRPAFRVRGQISDEVAWVRPQERPRGGVPSVTEKLLARIGF